VTVTTRKLNYPWRSVGTPIPIENRLCVADALKIGNLNFEVIKISQTSAPNTADNIPPGLGTSGDFFGITNPEKAMTVRADTKSYLGTVGSRYTIVQNSDAFAFFQEALGETAACIEAVGCLGRYGSTAFMVATMPEMLEIVPGDPVSRHIMLTTSHDGSSNIEARFLHWREANNSGVQFTGKREGRVRIRHTKNANLRLQEAHRVLSADQQYWDRAIRAYRYMAKRTVANTDVKDFLERLYPAKSDNPGARTRLARERLNELFQAGCPGSDLAGTTSWGLYNTVCYFVEHNRENRGKRAGSKWEIATVGPGSDLRQRAFRLLTEGVDIDGLDENGLVLAGV